MVKSAGSFLFQPLSSYYVFLISKSSWHLTCLEVETVWNNIFHRILSNQPKSNYIPALQQKLIALGRGKY